MAFTGNEDHSIDLSTASEWTENYRNTIAEDGTIAEYFGSKAITDILAQNGCVGIRIYRAIDDKGVQRSILVGVMADENDMYQGLLADRSFLCPQRCPSANPLNTSGN